jgi:septum formation protein
MAIWLADKPLVLASNSEARKRMLEAASIPLVVRPANIDERAVEASEKPSSARVAAAVLAREKARTVSLAAPGELVLGADQTLALGERRLSKPQSRDEAREQLRALSGTAHELTSACAIALDGKVLTALTDTARLSMRALHEDFIERYLDAAGAQVHASVGGYQIEGLGVHLFDRIEGDYLTILGLPLLPLLAYLRRSRLVAE